MFVLKSKHEALWRDTVQLALKHKALVQEWNALADLIIARGDLDALKRPPAPQFDAEDVKRLLQLCHPDKHDGKPMAADMTAKLLKLKESLS